MTPRERQSRIISVNMKHFKGQPDRVERLVDIVKLADADIIGVYEVTGREVYRELQTRMRDHMWVQSDHPEDSFKGGRESQKILVGIRKNHFAFFSLLSEFRSYNPYLRPGVFVSVTTPTDVELNFLFLHLKSGANFDGLGTRQKQYASLLKLGKKTPNFIALGDLNTMGGDIPYIEDFEQHHELRYIDGRTGSRGLRRLSKTTEITWWPEPDGRYEPANLDHVIASDSLNFTEFEGSVHIRTIGPGYDTTPDEIRLWRETVSDHSILYAEVNT